MLFLSLLALKDKIHKGKNNMKIVKFFSKLLVKIVAAIMIVALLLVLVSLFVTPATFGLEDLEINGVTIEEQGLANTTFYNIGKIALGILIVEEEESVGEDAYSSVTEKLPEVSSSSSSSSISSSKDESLTNLTSGRVYFEEEVEIAMNSDELSALLNMAIGSISLSDFSDLSFILDVDTAGAMFVIENASTGLETKVNLSDAEEYFEMSVDEILELMQEYDCEFISVVPTVVGEYVNVETKLKIALPDDVVSEINSLGVITVSNTVYCTFDSLYTIENGELVPVACEQSTMRLNSLSVSDTETVVTSAMGIAYGSPVDGSEVLVDYNNGLSKIMATILNNLGEIQGVEDGELVLVTRTE